MNIYMCHELKLIIYISKMDQHTLTPCRKTSEHHGMADRKPSSTPAPNIS